MARKYQKFILKKQKILNSLKKRKTKNNPIMTNNPIKKKNGKI